jgi:4-hydroxy-tetrahydrodipicolinate synthase
LAELGRLITAMVTPFDSKGDVDYKQAKKLALALLNSGSDGLLVSGSTGEAPTLSKEEKLRLLAEVKSAVGNRGAVIGGTGNYNTRESIELTREAEKIGVDAVLLVVPYYNKPTQQGLKEHFQAIAKSTSLPCILYNVPSRTITSLSAETVVELSRIDNIVGLKEASGDLVHTAKILDGAKKGFLLYSGNDNDTFPVLSIGGYGVISVASHLVGIQMSDMISKAVSGKTAKAAAMHHKLLPLMNVLFVVANPIPIKYALNYVGFNVGKPRLPLTPPDEKSAKTIEAVLKGYKIDLPLS